MKTSSSSNGTKPVKSSLCKFYYVHFQTDNIKELSISDDDYREEILKQNVNFYKTDIYSADVYNYINVLVMQRTKITDKIQLEWIKNLFKNNKISYGENNRLHRLKITNKVAELLMRMEDVGVENIGKSYSKKSQRVNDNVKRIFEYIEMHYSKNFTSYDIEKDLLINFDYANRIFKKYFGCSIMKFRTQLRINMAKDLIGTKTMKEVALEVGFNDEYYFSRCFKKTEGISPEKYYHNITNSKTI